MRSESCDVLIVGGGAVGSALAVALEAVSLRTVLVEARDPTQLEQPGFDTRVTALAGGSQRILAGLGIWDALRHEAQAISAIHISERGRFGAARIVAADERVPALGYTIENRSLGAALWSRLEHAANCTVLAPATLSRFVTQDDGVAAEVEHAGDVVTVHAKLLVAADGARSTVRASLGIAVREDRYPQQAIILNATTDAAHDGKAFERFTRSGPLAVLPLSRGRVGVVWTLPTAQAEAVAALEEGDFRDALQEAFGYRLGRIRRIGARASYPLSRVRSDRLGADRVLLIGNAAVSLHPVAGQGFNLALRDVAALAELLAGATRAGGDVGCDAVLRSYREWRAGDQRRVAWFTHGLVGLFGYTAPGLGVGRGLGLMAFDLLPGAKRTLARHTMGVAGRLPRLARGLTLDAG